MASGRIRVLSRTVADQIAAGEVVERPASVVKELVENSLDAGATRVQVEIDAGGIGRILVRDNGHGLGADEAELAFARHATSKLEAIEDLETVATFGFRGEALPSIASVSRVSLKTRRREDLAGLHLVLAGGDVVERRETGCPAGAEIEVADLFFNTPARLKFMKRDTTEAGHCAEALVRLALARPDVAFALVSAGRRVRELPRVERVEERVAGLFPDEPLAVARGADGGVEVLAVLGPPHRARAGAGSLYTYVDGRFVRDRAMLKAVSQGFGGTLESGRYPAGLVAIRVPAGGVDVNVHPQKTEVRFADPSAVYRAVARVVAELAGRAVWARGVAAGAEAAQSVAESPAPYGEPRGDRLVPPPRFADRARPGAARSVESGREAVAAIGGPIARETAPLPIAAAAVPADRPFFALRYVGQARGMYLVLEDERDLILIDQHAAHERVTYERLRGQLAKGRLEAQRLLAPHHVDVGPAEAERIAALAAPLSRLGLEISRAGPDRIAVRSVPATAGHASPDRLLAELVLALEAGRDGSGGASDDKALATLACHGSIRAGRAVTDDEARELLRKLDGVDFAGHCPHGRPVIARIPWTEIDRRVGRG
jgi:DNA mismatch repair protein MutL